MRLLRSWMFAAVLGASPLASGCQAIWEDLRDPARRGDGGPGPTDAGASPSDSGPSVDSGAAPTDSGLLDAGSSDAGAEVVLARATVEGRGGYMAEGTAELVSTGGRLEVRFGADFSSQSVPGPIVVLSRRPDLGSSLDGAAGDLDLGVLMSARGAQRYAAPAGSEDRAYVWIYCLPFGVEIARGPLAPVP